MPAVMLRGAKPTPRHVLAAATPHRVVQAPAPQFGIVPPKLDMWGNNQYGDCVSAEEAFAKAWWSVYCGLPETFATANEVIAFARQYGWLNGAYLTEVMDVMISKGMSIGGKMYMDGAYKSVDYSNELILQDALDPADGTGGVLKIGIDANALPSGAGNNQGWYALNKGNYGNEDHCVSLAGYGRADYLYDLLKVAVPSGLTPSTTGYLLYTWSTIGFVTHDWLMGTCQEAWVRNPTTPGQSPTPVPPSPPSPPVPPPPGPVVIGHTDGVTVQLTGGYVTAFGRQLPVHGATVAIPSLPVYGQGEIGAGGKWVTLIGDGMAIVGDAAALVSDFKANPLNVPADVAKLEADLEKFNTDLHS